MRNHCDLCTTYTTNPPCLTCGATYCSKCGGGGAQCPPCRLAGEK
jgi:hypothetical protein